MAGQATVTQPGGYIQTECKLWNIGHQNITIHHLSSQCSAVQCSAGPCLGTAALVTAAPAVSSRGGSSTEARHRPQPYTEFEVPKQEAGNYFLSNYFGPLKCGCEAGGLYKCFVCNQRLRRGGGETTT